jgi:signal peptidase II
VTPLSSKTRIGLFFVIIALIVADQVSKWWVLEKIVRLRSFEADGSSMDFLPWLFKLGQEQMPPFRSEVTSFFDIVMAWNTGVSFSMFASDHQAMVYVLIGVALLLSLVFTIWLIRTPLLITALPLAMVVAGALSNVWDRVRFGAVADFLYFHVGEYGWPAFNLADSCIVAGVAILAFDGLFLEPRRTKKALNESIVSDVS